MNIIPKWLRSGVAVLLALCLIIATPSVALAVTTASCGEEAAEATVAEAKDYAGKAAAVVDELVNYAMTEYGDIIAEAAADPETYRSMAVKVIKKELGNRAATVEAAGFDPNNDDDLTLLANEVYDVAIAYYNDSQAYGEDVAEVNANVEVIRFYLVEKQGYSDEEAVETAELYYELSQMEEADAVEHVMSLQEHSYVDGVCSNCGAEDPNYVPPTEPEVTEPEATEPEATEPEATEPEATEPEATEPEATEPEATEPEATEPEATEPEATEPEATEPEATEPEATEPEATEPEATEPEATEPEATEPEATEPEATEPEATEPEATEPEATEPEEVKPAKPSINWKDLLKKWFGNKDEEEEPTEPEATEPEATEPEATEPSVPVQPVKPSNPVRQWIKGLLSWLNTIG